MPYQRPRTAIGSRRETALLEQPSTSDDGMGGQGLVQWTAIARPWVNVMALANPSGELLAAGQVTSLQTYQVDMRYREGVRPTMRLRWRDKVLQIHTIVDDEMAVRRLVLKCTEVQ